MTDFLKDGKIIENKEIGTGNYLLKIKTSKLEKI